MGAGTVHGFWCSSEQQLGWGESASTLPSQTLQWSNQLSLHKTGISQSQKLHGRRRICPWPAWHGYHPSTLVPGMVFKKSIHRFGLVALEFRPRPLIQHIRKIKVMQHHFLLKEFNHGIFGISVPPNVGHLIVLARRNGFRRCWCLQGWIVRASGALEGFELQFFFRSEQLIILLWGMCSKNICYGHLWTMIWMWLWNVMNIFLAFYKLMVI